MDARLVRWLVDVWVGWYVDFGCWLIELKNEVSFIVRFACLQACLLLRLIDRFAGLLVR